MLTLNVWIAISGDLDIEMAGWLRTSGRILPRWGHVEVCPHGRPIVKRVRLSDLLRELGRA